MAELDDHSAIYDRRTREIRLTSEQCLRLRMIEGKGPVTPTALIAAVGYKICFKNDRQLAGWLA
ncbi:hypothetical protein [Phyllobacterium chamaecytisi]|uniref:hypothetical protein n=1 Tax=Phyllobacterium chamaecytisi TaxID=2876082 RepID=UPI001CCBB9E1|nr:hypothetical protein [Phyllobacterium sp. KW56]MBZ9603088.1 hypothetical protein [Phyllobacterium sp. KW56]